MTETGSASDAVTRIDFETDDRDAAADAIEGTFGFRARLNGREIAFRQQSVFAADVSYTELLFGAAMRSEVEPNPTIVVSEIPRGRYVVTRGRDVADLSHGGLFLLPTGSAMRVDLDHTVIRTYNLGPVEQLREVARQTAPEAVDLDLDRLRPISPAAERYLRDSLGLYRRHFLGQDQAVRGLASAEAFRHLLVTAASSFGLMTPRTGPSFESIAVRRARDFVADHLREPLTVDDLALAARTGVRSLQIAFRRELSCSPMDYVRQARLAAARADLLSGAEDDLSGPATVAGVATRWGFLNAGRFSSLYVRRYGEYPSDTLRRR